MKIVRELDEDMRSALDRFAPLRTRTKRCGKTENRRLSTTAREAKRGTRRLERRYAKSRSTDRRAYRGACRAANRVISEARSSYIRRQVDEAAASSPRLLGQTVGRLLHPSSNDNWFDGMDTAALAEGFMDKVRLVKFAVNSGLKSMYVTSPQIPLTAPSSFLSTFTLITAAEVARLIQAAPTTTSPLDTLPISLLKQCTAELSSVIAHLANRSFTVDRFPTLLKTGHTSAQTPRSRHI